mgnify:CR=1 FL=1
MVSCCELLTIFYLYKVLCSTPSKTILPTLVVNCLQFFIFTRFFAVHICNSFTHRALWIAYNFLSLQGSLQFCLSTLFPLKCCELLTIFYLYKVLCSIITQHPFNFSVVNCLQFFIFTRFFAVTSRLFDKFYTLWIAYNFLSLQGSLQLELLKKKQNNSCELLTIFYLYKVLCSSWFSSNRSKFVVNCLQFFIFTRFFAVVDNLIYLNNELWIAYNFLSLQGSLQCALLINTVNLGCELLTIFYLYKVLCSLKRI